MARRLGKTFSGKTEEIWETKEDGLMGAYDLKDWFVGLPVKYQNKILKLHQNAETKSSIMMKWKKTTLTSGEVEIHRLVLDKYAWS